MLLNQCLLDYLSLSLSSLRLFGLCYLAALSRVPEMLVQKIESSELIPTD